MVLVDTSVWVSHLRSGVTSLEKLLEEGKVVVHPFIIGELACGNLTNRLEILSLLKALPRAVTATHDECSCFIDRSAPDGVRPRLCRCPPSGGGAADRRTALDRGPTIKGGGGPAPSRLSRTVVRRRAHFTQNSALTFPSAYWWRIEPMSVW